ncbi:FHA domain-containing protein [Cryobacterium breve]|uniref:FHA domain-containing protein n=1 Tax=Cryobacterium breve TaxID=1259258 RepID=A0ABY7NE90_9MICO|nr:FHA domain-containing protein [Cryobacterium breve]WBM80821.1 FHA domain-containing protein [Cryobacterium breve]
MATTTRLDIDLAFSLAEPNGQQGGERMQGTITAAGTDVEIFASRPELFLQTRTITLKEVRTLAADLAERGLSVSLSGPNGLVVRLGAIPAQRLQRLLTGSAHVALGTRAALAPLLRRRRRASGAEAAPVVTLPPSTLFPLVPTLDRRIRRTVTTTHYTRGSGRPRLIFVVGSENWDGRPPRQFDLMPETTTIGSSPDADLRLDGLSPIHAEIRHDQNDEYVLFLLGPVAPGTESQGIDGSRSAEGGRILRTGARIELGPWRMAFFREEFADHGRPYGGRVGGELAYQKPQPARRTTATPRPAAPGRPAS